MTLIVTGIFGALLVTTFLSFMAIWLKAPPLIVIILIVLGLVFYDLYRDIRESRDDKTKSG
ncbi:MAG: hypothetical protein EXR02_04050 [Rhodospirillales bacterium]|nr:hypothetical protein [Rhodospirillales bacterium]